MKDLDVLREHIHLVGKVLLVEFHDDGGAGGVRRFAFFAACPVRARAGHGGHDGLDVLVRDFAREEVGGVFAEEEEDLGEAFAEVLDGGEDGYGGAERASIVGEGA